MSRGAQLARQWKILQHLLTHRRGATVQELVHMVGCHRRTLYRDLDALQEAGFPLHTGQEEGRRYWKVMDTYACHMPIPFNLAELTALYFSRDLLQAMQGSLFADALKSLFEKIRTTLPDDLAEYLNRMGSQIRFGHPTGRRLKDISSIIGLLNKSIGEQLRINMGYKALNQESPAWRKVDPYAIWVFSGTFYLIAYCHQRRDVRIFLLDRIQDIEPTSESFEPPADFDVDEYMEGSLGVFRGKPRTVKLRFSSSLASYIQETLWHPSQTVVEEADGSIILSMKVAVNQELEGWVLRWGEQVCVLYPAELALAIQNRSRAILANYEKMS
jgi:predicted DNA-binding transcriptional regulator YafY